MALVRTITPDTMKETMKDYGRDYYSYEGCKAIIELFEETDCGNDTEFDPIAICCDFTETTPEDIKASTETSKRLTNSEQTNPNASLRF